jgi:hypothetical protein
MFDKLKKIKTPHGNHFNHLRNMFGYFLAGALLTVFIGLGADVVGSLLSAALGAALAAAVALLGGIFVTMIFRTAFRLVQTGRILQYAGFWLSSWLGLEAAIAATGSLTLSNSFVASLAFFGISFGAATLFGQVPWRGRSWMPIRRP